MQRSTLVILATGVVVCLAAPSARAQGPAAKAKPPAAGPASRVVKLSKHLRVDLTKRRVSFDAEVCLRTGALELLVCAAGTKEHESVLRTQAKASHVHAALLLLGLTPGKPAEWVMVDGDHVGRTLPPRGAGLKISLRWQTPKGKTVEVDASKFLAVQNQPAQPLQEWVFVGSDVFPDGRYWADSEGEIICVANFASAVIDVPFQNPNKQAQQAMAFTANTGEIPPAGTSVEVIIVPKPGAEKAPDARATLEIDPRGRFRLDGQIIARDALRDRAGKFIDHHDRGMVVIQAHPGAMVADIVFARDELTLGGVRQMRQQWVGVGLRVLPKTNEQKALVMKEWREKFANPRDFIVEPSRDAAEEIERVKAALAELKSRQALLEQYQGEIEKGLRAYTPTTQPAGTKAE